MQMEFCSNSSKIIYRMCADIFISSEIKLWDGVRFHFLLKNKVLVNIEVVEK